MTHREFRFGVVTGRAPTGTAWTATARRAEQLGYDVLLAPDTLNTFDPFSALAAAAAVTTTLRLGSYVLSAPNRTPGMTARQTESLQALSGGRFELGIGGGRPDAAGEAQALGVGFGTPAERLARVSDTIDAVRKLPVPPRVLIATARPRMLKLAAEKADTVALGLLPGVTEAELARVVASVGGDLELHVNVAAVAPDAESIPPALERSVGGDPRAMAAAGGFAFLIGSPERIADTLARRREELGISYIGVSGPFMEQFAPVIPLLRR